MDKRERNIALSAVAMGLGVLFVYLLFGGLGFFVALATCVVLFLIYAIPEHRAYTKSRSVVIVMLKDALQRDDKDVKVYCSSKWGSYSWQELLDAVKKETYPGQDYVRAYLQNH